MGLSAHALLGGDAFASDVDVDIGTAPQREARAGSPQPKGSWFEALTPFGPMRIGAFPSSAGACHACDAAIALHRCEELLGALDAWSGLDLAWRWAPAPPRSAGLEPGARAWWRADTGADANDAMASVAECVIDSPWALLRSLPAPGEALSRRLHWPAVAAVLSVAQIRLGDDELEQLEPGGAVVLPPSLLPHWHGWLRSLGESTGPGLGVPVALPSPGKPRVVKLRTRTDACIESARSPDDERWPCEVRLALPHAVCASLLTGWFDAELGAAGPQASLWRCATEDEPALCLAIGRLMPWGDGWALGFETVWAGATADRPQADDIRRPPPEGDEQSGRATFAQEKV